MKTHKDIGISFCLLRTLVFTIVDRALFDIIERLIRMTETALPKVKVGALIRGKQIISNFQ